MDELDAAPEPKAPGRFGFDAAELTLHQAEAHLVLDRADDGRAHAESSVAVYVSGIPAWAAASLVLAQSESVNAPQDTAQPGARCP
jgi:hypothetical protein